MINNIVICILCLCLIGLVLILTLTLTRCQEGRGKVQFIYFIGTIFLTVLGYLLEITAGTADGGFVAIKLAYTGMMFLPLAFLVFVFAYCEAKLSRVIKWLLVVIASIISILIWTTYSHGLIYTSIEYIIDAPIHHIKTVKGSAYYVMHLFPMLCATIAFIMLLFRLIKGDKKYRSNILLMMLGVFIPLMVNILFIFNLSIFEINLTPALMTFVAMLFYINIVHNNLFDMLPKANEIALQSMQEAFILVDKDKQYIHANKAAEKLMPKAKTKNTSNKKLPFEWQLGEDEEIVTPIKFSISKNDYYNANISPLLDEKNKLLGYIIIIQDITESVLLTKKLEQIAYTDVLTGISNRQHFMTLASAQFERAKRTGNNSFIIMFDVDHFKKVNDKYGHSVGDLVLERIAKTVETQIRPYDIFGRYGGEEFIIFVSDINEEDIKTHAERIRKKICGKPMKFQEATLTVSASFGVASVLSANDLNDVIKLADESLYEAKKAGRNRVMISK